MNTKKDINLRHRISALWIAMILCLCVHNIIRKLSLAEDRIGGAFPSTKAEQLGYIAGILLLPAIGAVMAQCAKGRGAWIASLCLAASYLAVNLLHLSELLYDFSFVQMVLLLANAVASIYVLIYTVRFFKSNGYDRRK